MGLNNTKPKPQAIDRTRSDKGLINKKGENTCFLNVVVQSLWHLPHFRERLLASCMLHNHEEDKLCLLCALGNLFSQFRFSRQTEIPPNILRETLAALHESDARFQIGEQEDAHEALNVILQWFHADHVQVDHENSQTTVCQPKCLAHLCFGSQVCTIRHCRKCNATSEPETEDQFLFSLYALSVIELDFYKAFQAGNTFTCPQQLNRSGTVSKDSVVFLPREQIHPNNLPASNMKILGEGFTPGILKNRINITMKFSGNQLPDFGAWRKQLDVEFNAVYRFVEKGGTLIVPKCPVPRQVSGDLVLRHDLGKHLPLPFQKQLQAQLDHLMNSCPGPAHEVRYSFSQPLIYTVNIVWPEIVNEAMLTKCHNAIPEILDLRRILRVEVDIHNFRIKAVAGYYGRHYIAFCWSDRLRKWLKFDDHDVRVIGKTWQDVCNYGSTVGWRFTVLFYETLADQPEASPSLAYEMKPNAPKVHSESSLIQSKQTKEYSQQFSPEKNSSSQMDMEPTTQNNYKNHNSHNKKEKEIINNSRSERHQRGSTRSRTQTEKSQLKKQQQQTQKLKNSQSTESHNYPIAGKNYSQKQNNNYKMYNGDRNSRNSSPDVPPKETGHLFESSVSKKQVARSAVKPMSMSPNENRTGGLGGRSSHEYQIRNHDINQDNRGHNTYSQRRSKYN